MTDRLKQLETYTTRELIEELRRRITELDEARALLGPSPSVASATKNPKISTAKAKYWFAWHEYKNTHPNATVTDWRKAQKQPRKTK